jgi:hypothetical protein
MMELYPLIIADSPLGQFLPDRLQELKRFCEEHLGYHIISSLDLCRFNRCLGNADGYFLATGDSNPEFAVDFRPYLLNAKVTGRELLEASNANISPQGRRIKSRFYS